MQMVRKSVADHRDWDEHLQYLLLACREAPCSSTGFSPFELLFGREVYGPLDILRQQWVPAKTTSTTVTEWLLKLRTDLTEMRTLAINHQENTQARTKAWFDQSATTTSFHKGDQVLVFTPAFSGHRSQKLEDRWCGPYTILGSLSPVTYSVDMPERHKRTRSVHITALKLWIPPGSNILYIFTDPSSLQSYQTTVHLPQLSRHRLDQPLLLCNARTLSTYGRTIQLLQRLYWEELGQPCTASIQPWPYPFIFVPTESLRPGRNPSGRRSPR